MQGFTAGEASKLTGVLYDRLDYWARSGFLKPGVTGAKGKGSRRLYSFRDLVALRTAKELRDMGVPLQTLRKVVGYLRRAKGLENPLAEAKLVISGSDVLLVQGREELVSVLDAPGQGVLQLVMDLPKMVEELRERIKELRGIA
ncbi:MAG: helix-turn-helix domain-containing protein [Peptococcaceae bacterium MAG4]|nr:helix-turn-helix domain-containing protein [Peptococcaceae bacterium MAG4]